MISRRRSALVAAVIAVASTLTACGGSDEKPDNAIRYVALGDSAVAGAGIKQSDQEPCLRSDHNYPSLVADALGVGDFVDVSCPGATTDDVLYGQTQSDGEPTPPQIEQVTKDTDVVTISIGGNDDQYIPLLFTGCYLRPNNTPATCQAAIAAITPKLPEIKTNIMGVIDEIKKQAPSAQVVVVTYLPIAPESGTCAAFELGGDDLKAAAAAERAISATMQQAAEASGVQVLSMTDAAEGHDACSGTRTAWTNAIDVAPGDGTFLHPRAVGAEAVAKALEPLVKAKLTAPAAG